MITQIQVDRTKVAASLIEAFSAMSQQLLAEKETMLRRYRQHCITIGREVKLVSADHVRYGTAVNIDDNGALLIAFPDGSICPVNAGEVSIRGMYGYI